MPVLIPNPKLWGPQATQSNTIQFIPGPTGSKLNFQVDEDEHEDAVEERHRLNSLDDPMDAAGEERREREEQQESDGENAAGSSKDKKKRGVVGRKKMDKSRTLQCIPWKRSPPNGL